MQHQRARLLTDLAVTRFDVCKANCDLKNIASPPRPASSCSVGMVQDAEASVKMNWRVSCWTNAHGMSAYIGLETPQLDHHENHIAMCEIERILKSNQFLHVC